MLEKLSQFANFSLGVPLYSFVLTRAHSSGSAPLPRSPSTFFALQNKVQRRFNVFSDA